MRKTFARLNTASPHLADRKKNRFCTIRERKTSTNAARKAIKMMASKIENIAPSAPQSRICCDFCCALFLGGAITILDLLIFPRFRSRFSAPISSAVFVYIHAKCANSTFIEIDCSLGARGDFSRKEIRSSGESRITRPQVQFSINLYEFNRGWNFDGLRRCSLLIPRKMCAD